MVVKIKETFGKSRHVKNIDKSKKYILRERNTKYHKKFYLIKRNLIIQHNFVISTCLRYVDITNFVNFLEDGNRYKVDIFRVH